MISISAVLFSYNARLLIAPLAAGLELDHLVRPLRLGVRPVNCFSDVSFSTSFIFVRERILL
jgi:hypothetical protein